MNGERIWLLLLLAPILWFFGLHLQRSLRRYAGRGGGREVPTRRTVTALLGGVVVLALVVLLLER